jgi:plastocyanin
MKNHFNESIAFRTVLITSLLLIAVFITGSGISCQSQTPESAPTVPSPGLPKEPSSAEPPTAPPQIEVAIDGFAFKPAEITVPAGTTVMWYNNDSVIHTATARDGSFDSGSLSNGDTFSHTFEAEGSFEYYCIPHPYMTGEIIVE